MFDKSTDHGKDVMALFFIFLVSAWFSKKLQHKMDVKTAHFDIISMADKSTDSGKLMSIY